MKKPILKVSDFFHVEVVETETGEKEGNYISKFKLLVKDGPIKNTYLYFDLRLNAHLEEEIEKHICEICGKTLNGVEIGTGTGLAHESCYYSPAGKQLLFEKTEKAITDIINYK